MPTPREDNATAAGSHGTWVAGDLDGVGFIPRHSHRPTLRRISEAGESVDASGLVSGRRPDLGSWLVLPAGGRSKSVDVIAAIDAQTGHIADQILIFGDYSFAYGNGASYGPDFSRGLLLRIGPDFKVYRSRWQKGRRISWPSRWGQFGEGQTQIRQAASHHPYRPLRIKEQAQAIPACIHLHHGHVRREQERAKLYRCADLRSVTPALFPSAASSQIAPTARTLDRMRTQGTSRELDCPPPTAT